MTLLHLLPHFDYSAAGRQVSLLAPRFPGSHVAAFGEDRPVANLLRAVGVPVHALGSGMAGWWRLRRLVAQLRPHVVHAWRLPAVRAATLGRRRFRLVVSEPLRGGRVNALDRRLLRSVDVVVASFPADVDALRRLGIAADRIRELPPVVPQINGEPPPLDADLPADAYVVMCVGRLAAEHGFRDAILAADVLQRIHPRTHLVLVGDGPDRRRLEAFARGINRESRFIRYLPARPDAAALLARADVAWVPGRGASGRQVVLEAMAAGRPVVATARRQLVGAFIDGQSGLLVPPRRPPEFARQTRRLLDDPAFAARLGAAAREAVTSFTPAVASRSYADLYAPLSRRRPDDRGHAG